MTTNMCDATTEECGSVNGYIESISNSTGYDFGRESCDDTISREMAIKCISENFYSFLSPKRVLHSDQEKIELDIHVEDAIKILKSLPSVKPEPKTGHWIDARTGRFFKDNVFRCSECGDYLDFNGLNGGRGHANYCPNCGAKMEVEHE